MERKRQKLVGRDKGSLTEQEQQRYRKGELYKTNPQNRTTLPDCTAAEPSRATSEFPPHRPSPPPEPSMTAHGMNTLLCLARLGLSQPTRLCALLDSGEN